MSYISDKYTIFSSDLESRDQWGFIVLNTVLSSNKSVQSDSEANELMNIAGLIMKIAGLIMKIKSQHSMFILLAIFKLFFRHLSVKNQVKLTWVDLGAHWIHSQRKMRHIQNIGTLRQAGYHSTESIRHSPLDNLFIISLYCFTKLSPFTPTSQAMTFLQALIRSRDNPWLPTLFDLK